MAAAAIVVETQMGGISYIHRKGLSSFSIPNLRLLSDCADVREAHRNEIGKMTVEFSKQNREDAFFLMDISRLFERYHEWTECMTGIEPFYSVKANPDPVLLRILALLGLGFDCASMSEIDTVLSMGVPPERIIYANTIKGISHLAFARLKNVGLMTFDNEYELKKIKEHYPEADLVLRIDANDPLATAVLGRKFGCDAKTKAPLLVEMATSMGLKLVGISFHVGWGSKTPRCYAEAIANAKQVFDIAKAHGHRMWLLDIGGGYPGYASPGISLQKIATIVQEAVSKHFSTERLTNKDFRVIAEPGSFFATATFSLCTSVIGKNKVDATEIDKTASPGTTAFTYTINDGVYTSFGSTLSYKIRPPCSPVKKRSDVTHLSKIWGQTCDSIDEILLSVQLPEMEIGDWVIFDYMGSYAHCIRSPFNGFDFPEVYYGMSVAEKAMVDRLSEGNDETSWQ